MNIEHFNENQRAKQESGWKGLHVSTLYDQDEDIFGAKINPATGKSINNSTDDPGAQKLTTVEADEKSGDALPPPLPEDDADDEAAKWLRENDRAKSEGGA